MSHQTERANALKRGGGRSTLSLDMNEGEAGYMLRQADSQSPEQVFETRWAMTILDRALDRLQAIAAADDKTPQFELLRQYLTSAQPQAPYREVATALGMTEAAVATSVHRLRKLYGQCLRSEIAETVVDPSEVDDELRHLLTVIRPDPDETP